MHEPASSSAVLGIAAARTSWQDLPADVQGRARLLLLDTLAVILAGSQQPPFVSLAFPASSAPGRDPASQTDSAVIDLLRRSAATSVLQIQEGHRVARGHPASQIVPVLMLVAEMDSALTGERFMSAFVAGYEIAARIGIALGGMQEDLHDTGTWAALGAAAAAAMLMTGGCADTIAAALETAAAMPLLPDRQVCLLGMSAHHLNAAAGASLAMLSALAAHSGLRAPKGTLERFFGPRMGRCFDEPQLLDGVSSEGHWTRFQILEGYLKAYPVCAHFGTLVELLDRAREAGAVCIGELRAVRVDIYGEALKFHNDSPDTALAARFSVPAIVASRLLDDGMLSGYDGDSRLRDPAFRSLMSLVSVHHEPGFDQFYPDHRPVRVRLQTIAGQETVLQAMDAVGDHARPMDEAHVLDKAKGLLATSGVAVEALRTAVHAVAEGGSPREILALLRGRAVLGASVRQLPTGG